MIRLLLLTILIGLLFTRPNSFAQSSKPKRATIKYENGVKYVGEIRSDSKNFNRMEEAQTWQGHYVFCQRGSTRRRMV